MKTLIMMGLLCCLPAAGQALFEGGTRVQDADGDDQASKPYTMTGPYVLRWVLSDKAPASRKAEPWWEPTDSEGWKRKWISVEVYDAATGERITGDVISGKENHLAIKVGGKHYVVASGPRNTAWTIWGKEGLLEITDKGPKLKPVPPVPPRAVNPPRQAEVKTPSVKDAPPPKPSSVPGLPPGVEPAKESVPALPPGVTKGR